MASIPWSVMRGHNDRSSRRIHSSIPMYRAPWSVINRHPVSSSDSSLCIWHMMASAWSVIWSQNERSSDRKSNEPIALIPWSVTRRHLPIPSTCSLLDWPTHTSAWSVNWSHPLISRVCKCPSVQIHASPWSVSWSHPSRSSRCNCAKWLARYSCSSLVRLDSLILDIFFTMAFFKIASKYMGFDWTDNWIVCKSMCVHCARHWFDRFETSEHVPITHRTDKWPYIYSIIEHGNDCICQWVCAIYWFATNQSIYHFFATTPADK